MKRWTIYCHTHVESGRRYIGLTVHTMMHRWNQHVAQSRSTKGGRWHFPNAVRLYGKDAFSHQVLEVCEDLDVANLAEECWIELFETRDPAKGFNVAPGGQHVPHPIRKNPWDDPAYREKQLPRCRALLNDPGTRAKCAAALDTPEVRARMSASSKATWSRPEVKAKLSATVRALARTPENRAARSRATKGRKLSPERVAQMAEARRGQVTPEEVRARISASMTGRTLSPEHVAKTRSKPLNKTHCPSGHPLVDAYVRGNGVKMCRVCVKVRNDRRKGS